MAMDPQDTRKVSRNWREYVAEMKSSIVVGKWIFKELINADSRKYTRRMLRNFAISSATFQLLFWLCKPLMDGLAEHRLPKVVASIAGMFVCLCIHSFFERRQNIAREMAGRENIARSKQRMNELFLEKSMGQHIQESRYLNTANIERGKSRIDQLESQLLFDGLPVLINLGIAFLALWIISPMAGLCMTGLLASYCAWTLYLNRNIAEKCTPLDKKFRQLNRHAHERWEKVERVKTSGMEQRECEYQNQKFREISQEDLDFWLWFIDRVTFRGFSNRFVFLSVISYAAFRVWNGDWSLGTLMPLWMWTMRVSDNLWQIGSIEHQINWNMPPIRTAMHTLTIPPGIVDKANAIDLGDPRKISVEFRKVSFAYKRTLRVDLVEDEERLQEQNATALPILKDISFTIKPGEKLAIIGESGSGKTTIMRLLQRYMDPIEGEILVNGHDLRDIKLASWKKCIAYIPQEAQVLDGTVRYNLLYGIPEDEQKRITDDELWDIVHKLRLDTARLTHGLDTLVGRHGIELSGGEKQRLMVAAAAAKKPAFMIIDEATSSLDSTTEKRVQEGLAEILGPEIGALIITHRLNTVRNIGTNFMVILSTNGLDESTPQVEAVAGSFERLYVVAPTFRQLADDQGVVVDSESQHAISKMQ